MSAKALTQRTNALLKYFIEQFSTQFKGRIQAIFKLGSLGKQGDFSLCSDVDVALFLDKITAKDHEQVNALWQAIKKCGLEYADRLSLFWSSYDAATFSQGIARFPPLDQLNLLQCGTLIYGKDCRDVLAPPTHAKIIQASAEFLATVLLTEEKLDEIIYNPAAILNKGARYCSKAILFPVRLMFSLDHPNTIATNKTAFVHYIKSLHFVSKSAALAGLVQTAYAIRDRQPYSYCEVLSLEELQANLPNLYLYCLERYLNDLNLSDCAALNVILETKRKRLSDFINK